MQENYAACPACGFPCHGSDGEKHKFLYMKSIPLRTEMDSAEEGVKKSRGALFVAAGIAFLNVLLGMSGVMTLDDPRLNTVALILVGLSGLIFLGLGIFIKKNPMIVSIIGLALAAALLHRSVLGIIIILVLAHGTWCAVKYNSTKHKFDTLSRKMSQYSK